MKYCVFELETAFILLVSLTIIITLCVLIFWSTYFISLSKQIRLAVEVNVSHRMHHLVKEIKAADKKWLWQLSLTVILMQLNQATIIVAKGYWRNDAEATIIVAKGYWRNDVGFYWISNWVVNSLLLSPYNSIIPFFGKRQREMSLKYVTSWNFSELLKETYVNHFLHWLDFTGYPSQAVFRFFRILTKSLILSWFNSRY